MKSPRDHALALLKKAANDLMAARATVATGKALDTVCFHSQGDNQRSQRVQGLQRFNNSTEEIDVVESQS